MWVRARKGSADDIDNSISPPGRGREPLACIALISDVLPLPILADRRDKTSAGVIAVFPNGLPAVECLLTATFQRWKEPLPLFKCSKSSSNLIWINSPDNRS